MIDVLFLKHVRTKYIPAQALLGLWRVIMGLFLGITGLAVIGFMIRTLVNLLGLEPFIASLRNDHLGQYYITDLFFYGLHGVAVSMIVFVVCIILINIGES